MTGTTATAVTTASKHPRPTWRSRSTASTSDRPSKSLLYDTPPRGIALTPRGYMGNPWGYGIPAGQSLAMNICCTMHNSSSGPVFLLLDGAAGRVAPDTHALETNRGENEVKKYEGSRFAKRHKGFAEFAEWGSDER